MNVLGQVNIQNNVEQADHVEINQDYSTHQTNIQNTPQAVPAPSAE